VTQCRSCGAVLSDAPAEPGLRSSEGVYHVRCAPDVLLRDAADEYAAIVRKGVHYFVEKYGAPTTESEPVGERFVGLGTAVLAETERRNAR
jgi:hypothetical protein